MEKLLNVHEVSKILGVRVSTLYAWAERRDKGGKAFIPCVKIGRLLKFKKEDVDEWVEARKVQGRGGEF